VRLDRHHLARSFNVDHVIPFDLWPANDIGNLQPSSKTANSKKSNKLPFTEIPLHRKVCIVGHWELLWGRNLQHLILKQRPC
jgi:CRISPR/Cas system Type II protein with McrA/HNH and RuvC-like nuclease domain